MPHRLVGVLAADDSADPSLKRVRLILDRVPPRAWAVAFDDLCRYHPTLDWQRGGDVLCDPTDEADVHQLLAEMVERANTFIGRHPAPSQLDLGEVAFANSGVEDEDPGGHLYRGANG